MTMPVLNMPSDPPTTASRTVTRIWEKEVDEYVKRKMYLQENLKTLYSLVLGQCTDVILAKLEASDTYNEMSEEADSMKLLKEIRASTSKVRSMHLKPCTKENEDSTYCPRTNIQPAKHTWRDSRTASM
jgi:hypothetical protein